MIFTTKLMANICRMCKRTHSVTYYYGVTSLCPLCLDEINTTYNLMEEGLVRNLVPEQEDIFAISFKFEVKIDDKWCQASCDVLGNSYLVEHVKLIYPIYGYMDSNMLNIGTPALYTCMNSAAFFVERYHNLFKHLPPAGKIYPFKPVPMEQYFKENTRHDFDEDCQFDNYDVLLP